MGTHTYSQLHTIACDIAISLRSTRPITELKRYGFDIMRTVCRDMPQCEGMDSVEIDVVGNDVWCIINRARIERKTR